MVQQSNPICNDGSQKNGLSKTEKELGEEGPAAFEQQTGPKLIGMESSFAAIDPEEGTLDRWCTGGDFFCGLGKALKIFDGAA